MRELGKASARARARPNPGRVPPSLREYLLENVEPARVWQAIERALDGSSESARVSAAKVLLDALAEPQQERDHEAAVAGARERLAHLIDRRAERQQSAEKDELERLRRRVAELEAQVAEYQVTA